MTVIIDTLNKIMKTRSEIRELTELFDSLCVKYNILLKKRAVGEDISLTEIQNAKMEYLKVKILIEHKSKLQSKKEFKCFWSWPWGHVWGLCKSKHGCEYFQCGVCEKIKLVFQGGYD
jgi:hypothetical protein